MTNNYREIEFLGGCSIEDAVLELLEHKEKGQLVCGSFNGHMLYSDKVTVDDAYMEILGKTKEEWDKQQQEWEDNYDRELKEHEAQIPTLTEKWIEEGHKILDEKYWAKWDECVPIRLGDLYRGMELGCCLDIVKSLNDGCSLAEAKKIIEDQNHSGMSFSLVRAMVTAFCNRGKEFAEYVDQALKERFYGDFIMDFDTKFSIYAMLVCIGLLFLIVIGTNSCSYTEWNNGNCPDCEVRYELRGASKGLKYYACPECGREVERY